MSERHDVPFAPDPAPHASLRAQVGGSGMRAGQGRRIVLALLGSPIAWVVHFLGTYLVVALWCAARWPGVRVAIVLFTALALIPSIAAGVLAFRLWRHGQAALLQDAEPGGPEAWDARMGERGARMSFLAVVSLFMAAVFTLLIFLEGLPALFTQACPATTMP